MKEFRKARLDEISGIGGSFHNVTFTASVGDLINILGLESYGESGDGKTKHEWVVKFGDKIFSIYDWKEYRDYPDDEIITWHIGSMYDAIEETLFRTEVLARIKKVREELKDKEENIIPINPAGEEETIEINLCDYPKAYKAKVDELVEQGMTEEEAKEIASQPITLELYYHKHSGLFAVETNAVEACPQGGLVSPYDPNVELVEEEE